MQVTQGQPAAERGLFAAPVGGLFVLVLVLGAALLLRAVSDLVVQLLFGGFLALVAWPLMAGLRRRNVPQPLALALTTFIMLVSIVAAVALVALSLGELVTLVPTYEGRLQSLLEPAQVLLANIGVSIDRDTIPAALPLERVGAIVQAIASSLTGAGVTVTVIALTMVFALAGGSTLQARTVVIFGGDHPAITRITRFAAATRRILLVRAQLGLFAAVLSFVLLLLLDVPLPALWASLVFAASFVPNIGAPAATIPPTVLALLGSGIPGALAVVVGYTAINFAQDNLVQPVAVGAELNLTPLVGFLGLIVWAWILGPAGAILAIPLTLASIEVLEAFPSTRALSTLMRNKTSDDAFAGTGAEPAGPRVSD
jgi:AI-2 transport protein TqsA